MNDDDIPELLATFRALSTAPSELQQVATRSFGPKTTAPSSGGSQEPLALPEPAQTLFQPPDPAREEAMLQELLERAPLFASSTPSRTEEPGPRPRPRPRPRRRAVIREWLPGIIALAAAILLALVLRPGRPLESTTPFLTTFDLELKGMLAEVRGTGSSAHDEVAIYRSDGHLDGWFRPRGDQPLGPVTLVAFAYDEQGHGHALRFPSEQARHGDVLHIRESIAAMGLGTGRWQLVFVLGQPGHLPTEPSDVAPGSELPAHAPFTVIQETVSVVSEPGETL